MRQMNKFDGFAHRLLKLAHAAFGDDGIVASIDLAYLPDLPTGEIGDAHGQESCKGNRVVIS